MPALPPLIGICAGIDYPQNNFYLRRTYSLIAEKCGALPVILGPLQKYASLPPLIRHLNGLILAGGSDIDPAYFKEEPHLATKAPDPERDRFEVALTRMAWEAKLPLLGICRGMQVINIALGGTLWQDLSLKPPPNIGHQQSSPPWHPTHKVTISPCLNHLSPLKLWPVNSLHHQGIKQLAAVLKKAAQGADGLIEAVTAADNRPVLGVQWHPEWLGQNPWGEGLIADFILNIEGN